MLFSPIPDRKGSEPSPIRLRALSLGAGVQSTTLALMAAHWADARLRDLRGYRLGSRSRL